MVGLGDIIPYLLARVGPAPQIQETSFPSEKQSETKPSGQPELTKAGLDEKRRPDLIPPVLHPPPSQLEDAVHDVKTEINEEAVKQPASSRPEPNEKSKPEKGREKM